MPRTRTVPARHVSRARKFSLASPFFLALAFGLVGSAPAANAMAPDTLSAQVVAVDRDAHAYLLDSIGERNLGAETLYDRASQVAAGALTAVEATCRTGLLPKYAEPGSPWLGWRLLARVKRDSCDWFIGALSCADTLCGGTLVSHERLALLSVTPARSRILVFPGQPSTIGDPGTCIVDSVALHKGASHILLQARRRTNSAHPCSDGPSASSAETADFFVLKGDRVTQAFTFQVVGETSDHDDQDGDSGSRTTGTLVVSPASIQLDGKTDEWRETADGDPKKTQHRIQDRRVRLRFRDGAGYMSVDSER